MMTAATIEIVQTIAALIGAVLTAYSVRDLHAQVRWLLVNDLNGQRLYWSRARRNEQLTLLAAQIVLLGSGLLSLALYPPDSLRGLPAQAQIRVWSETSVSVVLLIKTVGARMARARNEMFEWDGIERRRRQKGSRV